MKRGQSTVMGLVGLALAVVVLAPIVLSSQDLVRWAADPGGLGLPMVWAWLAFVALDAAAAVCVGMVTVAAWRGEGGGLFHVLTWLFAAGSAVANYRHGQTTPARDDEYFFPAMSLAGPLLLDVTLARVRRWTRIEERTQLFAHPRFGLRWLPGVGFRETLRAWQTSLREGIERPADAIAHVRETRALTGLAPTDALRFAWQALGHTDPYRAWQWLVARGVTIDQQTVVAATGRPQVRAARTTVIAGTVEPPQPRPARAALTAVPDDVPDEVLRFAVDVAAEMDTRGLRINRDTLPAAVRHATELGFDHDQPLTGPGARALWAAYRASQREEETG